MPIRKKRTPEEEEERKKRIARTTELIGEREKRTRALTDRDRALTEKQARQQAKGEIRERGELASREQEAEIAFEKGRAAIIEKGKGEIEVPEGREATDVQKEKGLREKGLMTIQYGTDELGFALTTIIPIEDFQKQRSKALLSEAETGIDILAKGAIATPAGIAGGVPSVAAPKPKLNVGVGKTSGNILKGDLKTGTLKLIEKDRQIRTLSRTYKVSKEAATKIYNQYQVTNLEKIGSLITNPTFLKYTAAGLIGTSGLTTWLAADNIQSGSSFTMIKLREAVESETLTKEEALEESEEIRMWISEARSYININTMINPFLWFSRKSFMNNADKAQVDFNLERERILNFRPEVRG